MKTPKLSEAAIGAIVVHWLESLGADVYQEVEVSPGGARADIVARVHAELWLVETKTSLSLALIEQAMEKRRFAHRVYIAAPASKARAGCRLCAELGLGLWNVVPGLPACNIPDAVVELTASRRWNREPLILGTKLSPAHKVHAKAGSITGGHWSTFRQTCEALAGKVREAGACGIDLRTAVSSIQHHYASAGGARSALAKWVRLGKVPGARLENGKLFPVHPL